MTGVSALPASAEEGTPMQWRGLSRVSGPGFLKMPVLTIGMLGLQIIWSVEMSNASPYLLSLGMSKSLMSVVFLAGPLSGLIVQPLIGVLSDRSHSRFGRRRPYILLGALVSFGAMYLLGFTREFASIVTTRGSTANDTLTICLAVWSIYCIDFSINAVQAMDRALLVDILPVSEQERGNAWAGRMFGLGSVFGFFVGNVDLTLSLPFLGHTQLEILCVITSCVLLLTHLVTVFRVKERILVKATDGTHIKFGLWHTVKDIWRNFFALPRSIKRICLIQLFSWIGWFPVLFWTSLYVGELHTRHVDNQYTYISVLEKLTRLLHTDVWTLSHSSVPDTDDAKAALTSEATRLGSRAMLCNALASLFASIVCPFFVSSANEKRSGVGEWNHNGYESGRMEGLKTWWKERPTCHLATLWAVSQGTFAICMLSTFLITSVLAATVVMTLTGFSWAITQWAPFALIAEAIHTASFDYSRHYVLGNAQDDSDDEGGSIPLRDVRTNRASDDTPLGNTDEARRLIFEAKEEEDDDVHDTEIEHRKTDLPKRVHFDVSASESPVNNDNIPSPMLGLNAVAQQSQTDIHSAGTVRSDTHMDEMSEEDGVVASMENQRSIPNSDDKNIEDKAGIILGIHNIFIVIPQFIITGLSSIIFAIMDPDKPALARLSSISTGNSTTHHDQFLGRSVLQPRATGEAGMGRADSVGVIFRIGGVSAAVACVLCIQLARELKQSR